MKGSRTPTQQPNNGGKKKKRQKGKGRTKKEQLASQYVDMSKMSQKRYEQEELAGGQAMRQAGVVNMGGIRRAKNILREPKGERGSNIPQQ